MSHLFFTADTHFDHKNIIKYERRPYHNTHEMNQALIDNWNKRVGKKDRVIHLGDFSWGGWKVAAQMLEQLNGRKFLIQGNHDPDKDMKELAKYFEWIKSYCSMKTDVGRFILFHYPIVSWENKSHGSIHLHGHTHSRTPTNIQKGDLIYNVGVDTNGYAPISLDEVLDKLGKNRDID